MLALFFNLYVKAPACFGVYIYKIRSERSCFGITSLTRVWAFNAVKRKAVANEKK